ncbi:hypothetical protein ACQKGC_10365 [Allorhizobium pseudoryzae]|uniref:hypothetical protein n=1 Tax=Allorhizobium pseudoryzae TaxID=379684 RepID=UPI003CFD7B50
MSGLSRLWAGNIYGTNTGNVFVELESGEQDDLKGLIRIQDHLFGLALYDVSGKFDGKALTLRGQAKQGPDGVELGEVEIAGTLTENGQIRGRWSSTLGTGGTFILHPHDQDQAPPKQGPSPERLHTAVREIGAVRLYAEDVKHLIQFIASDFGHQTVTVSFRERRTETNMYAVDFLKDIERLGEQRYLRLFIQEPDLFGVSKLVVIELNANGENEIRVQGAQESWVTGKAESLLAHMKSFERPLATSARKFGLNVNGLMLLFVVALIPDLDFWRRIAFLAAVVIIAGAVVQLHKRLVPNTVIYLSPRKPGVLGRAMPSVLSWGLALSSALAAAIIYGFINGEIPKPW